VEGDAAVLSIALKRKCVVPDFDSRAPGVTSLERRANNDLIWRSGLRNSMSATAAPHENLPWAPETHGGDT